jgi:hypothetical protein
LLAKCTLTVMKLALPFTVSHWATRGFRLEVQAGFSGSIRPGLYLRLGPGRTSLAVVAVPGLGERRRRTFGSKRYAVRMLPPGWPPLVSSVGSMLVKA